jgi:hypothetical protein
MLSTIMMALTITVICLSNFLMMVPPDSNLQTENCIDEWKTSEHVDVQFTAAAYKYKFNLHLKKIIEFRKKTQESDIIPHHLKHMLKMAR